MTSDYYLIHFIYALLLRTWEAKFLRFKNVTNFDKATNMAHIEEKRNILKYLQKFLNKIKQYEKQLKETKCFLNNKNNFKWILYFWPVYV